jgi:hypothetical protein
MFAFGLKKIIGVNPIANVFDSNTSLFGGFADSAVGNGLAKFKMAARTTPRTIAMSIFSFLQQNFSVFFDNYTNSNPWPFFFDHNLGL